jgi:hypothetical protein
MVGLIILVFAFVLLLIEAFRPATAAWPWPVPHLGWLGAALAVLYLLLSSAGVRG